MKRRFLLDTKRSRSRYKSDSTWLNAVYRENKSFIDEAYVESESGKSKREIFKQDVKEYMEVDGLTAKQAVKAISRSTKFTTEKERFQYNAYEALRDDKEAFKEFRNLNRDKGKFQKIDLGQFEWIKEEHAYIYGGKIKISFENSPKEVIVEELDDED